MKKYITRIKEQKDIGPGLVVALGLILLCAKLLLASAQNVFLWPDESGLDDMVMYNSAVSITQGEWLGAYGYTTLAKNSFFALWLAALHVLGIPFLLGGQALWGAASAAAAAGFSPIFRRRWAGLLLYAVLLFSPSSTANPAPNAFVARVYRDNIFPALCLLCVAGLVGFALRRALPLRHAAWWLVLAGLSFGACWLCREDGWWLLPFAVGAVLVTLVFVVRGGLSPLAKVKRALCLSLPFVLCGALVAGWCTANSAAYGRFIVNDFSSGEFAAAYGAMTRVRHESWNPKVDVPLDVRVQLYERVPAFNELKSLLESQNYLERYHAVLPESGEFADYSSGAFYWALREAAAARGYYDSPQKAQLYWENMAVNINALCDTGALAAGPPRSSVNPPIRAEYIGPVLAEGLHSLWFSATFQDCDARSLFSPAGNDPTFYAETLRPMEEFLHDTALTATKENSIEPYYNPWQVWCFKLFDIARAVYAVLLPLGLLLALAWQGRAAAQLAKRLAARQRSPRQSLLWVLMLGLLLCILLRAFMMAFVTVSSFNIGTYVMYLASIHPLMLLYAFVGSCQLALALRTALKNRAARKSTGESPQQKVDRCAN